MTRIYRPGSAGRRDSSPDPKLRPDKPWSQEGPRRYSQPHQVAWYRRWFVLACEYERQGLGPVEAKHKATAKLRADGIAAPWDRDTDLAPDDEAAGDGA